MSGQRHIAFTGFEFPRTTTVEKAVRDAGLKGLEDGGEFLLEESNRTIPHETGEMERSGLVSKDETAGEVAVSYNTPYAPRQHEDTRLSHDEGRRPKWLEQTVTEQSGRIIEHVADAVSKAIGN